jgi:hypothetical protein
MRHIKVVSTDALRHVGEHEALQRRIEVKCRSMTASRSNQRMA